MIPSCASPPPRPWAVPPIRGRSHPCSAPWLRRTHGCGMPPRSRWRSWAGRPPTTPNGRCIGPRCRRHQVWPERRRIMVAQKERFLLFPPGQIFYNDCASEADESSRVAEGKRFANRPRTGMSTNRTTILFVDDDVGFLDVVRNLMLELSEGTWEVLVAPDAAHALGLIHEHKIDLLVIDVRMPVMDGLQFLALLHRNYPSLLKVALTGHTTETYRAACLSNGAELFLEKPVSREGWKSLYSTLKQLVRLQPEEGFRGMLRRVGLQDVLQMECLARSSSVLEISTTDARGSVFVQDGQIVHAQVGNLD